jgi:hypothetical protein
MKKIVSVLALLSLMAIVGGVAFADETPVTQPTTCTIRHVFSYGGVGCIKQTCTLATDIDCASCCMIDKIYTITDWIFLIVMALAIIFILVGAMKFITASGSPEKAMEGRNYLIYGAIGIIVALLAKAFPAIVKSIAGMG